MCDHCVVDIYFVLMFILIFDYQFDVDFWVFENLVDGLR